MDRRFTAATRHNTSCYEAKLKFLKIPLREDNIFTFCRFESSVQTRTLELDIHVTSRLDHGVENWVPQVCVHTEGVGDILLCSSLLLFASVWELFVLIPDHCIAFYVDIIFKVTWIVSCLCFLFNFLLIFDVYYIIQDIRTLCFSLFLVLF